MLPWLTTDFDVGERIKVNKIILIVISVFCLATSSPVLPDSYPFYFESITKDSYSLIIFRDPSRATYLSRTTRPDHSIWFFLDDHATWGNYPKIQGWTPIPSLWIKTTKFRFDYYMKGKALVSREKSGDGKTYLPVQNENKEAPNQAMHVTPEAGRP